MIKDKPAIGILINALNLGGAEKQSLLQAKLMSREFEVYFFVQRKKPQLKQHLDFIRKENINYIQLPGNMLSRSIRLISLIKKYRIRILFAYLTLDNVLAAITSVFVKSKFVGGIRNSHLPWLKFIFNRLSHKYFLDFSIFNNYSGMDLFLNRGFIPSKSLVIHNCIDNIKEEMTRKDGNPVKVLSVGRFTYQKDYLTALKTISLLQKKCRDKVIEYTIIGDGELDRQIQTWIADLNISNVKIIRLPENIGTFFADADIYFLSSLFEGLPNTIMEAMNYSLPVVTTDVSDVGYLVKEGMNGFLSPAGDYTMLSEKLYLLVTDPAKRNEFGTQGHRLLVKEFSEEKYQDAYLKFARELLSE